MSEKNIKLVIAEKPSVAQSIAKVIGADKREDGYLEGNGYIVSLCVGHLVELASPEFYDEKYEKWRYEDLPILPSEWNYQIAEATRKQFGILKKLMEREDVTGLVEATDAGREGELIFRLVYDQAKCKKPFERLWISSMEDQAISDGFSHLKNGRKYDDLYRAALCRERADWIVGMNATRLFSTLYGQTLNVGRVMTPTLAMIAQREQEIREFVPKPYYTVTAAAGGVVYTWKDEKSGGTRISDPEKAKQIAEKAKRYPLVLQNVEKKKKQKEAPLLYDLTELQRDASARFGYSAKQTLNLMQSLYETHKVLTYPRTDSRYLTKDIVPTLKERLDAVSIGPYKALAQQAKRSPLNGKLSFVNDAKVSDHHAIIPTEQYVQLSALSNEERRIYDLVVRRFLAVLLPPCVYEETVIQASIEKECFTARGKRMVEKGWQEAYEDNRYDEEDEAKEEVREQNLPLLEAGMKIGQPKISLREGKTKPPARFTEGTLLSAMENPVRYMENRDSSLVKTIGEAGGLGTVATRADIIEKLFRSFLMEKKGNEIYLTSKARQLLKLVPADLKKPELTASWEMQLNDIAKGKKRRDVFMKEIRSYTVELIDEIKTEEGTFRHDNLTNKKCPNCGKRLLAVNGKNAKLLVCQDRECGYRETVSRTTNARCPVCHKRMEMIGKGEDATFVCACGHKERMTKFQERRKKEGGGVTKRDVAAYMKKQKKEAEEPVNNAFAAALKGIKL